MRERTRQGTPGPQLLARDAGDAAGEHLELVRGGRRRRLRRGGRDRPPLGGGIEQYAQDLGARDAVDRCVVDLREHRDAAALEALDDVHLPQRARAVQRPCVDPRDLLGELMVIARRGQGQFAHVVLEVEVGILDPVRVIEAERNQREPPAERRQQMQALQQHRGHALRGQDTARCRGRVVDRQARDMAMGTAVLHG